MFVRVVLDTCAVLNHMNNEGCKIDLNLVRQNRNLVRISLSATAFVELARKLVDGSLPFARWRERIPSIDAVLDERWPCLPDGKQLAWLTGTQTTDPGENLEDEARHMRACWFHLLDVAPEEIGKCQVAYRVSDGTLRGIRLDAKALREFVAGRRREWIDYVRKMQTDLPARGFTARDDEAIFEAMRSDFGNEPLDAPDVAEKLDAALRMIARFVARSLPSKVPSYDPETERRRGDAFDLDLLFYVPLPAIVVTGDTRFVRGLRETDAPHSRLVLTVDEFNAHLKEGSLAALVSDFQTPERQHRRQSEAAYFRWHNRGRPPGDDMADWFASEPVA